MTRSMSVRFAYTALLTFPSPNLKSDDTGAMRHLEDSLYPLLWAFDRLGERLFGNTWDGNEYQRKQIESPDDIEAKRTPLEVQLAEFDRKEQTHRTSIKRSLKEAVIHRHQSAIAKLIEQRVRINGELALLPSVDGSWRRRYAAYERKASAEQTLIDAFGSGDLAANFVGGLVIDRWLWSEPNEFRYYLAESLGVISQRYSSCRRSMIVVPRTKFDEWLKGIKPIVVSSQTISPEDLFRARLRQDIKGAKPGSKTAYRERVLEEFTGLSRRAFDRVWDQDVPDSWKRSGRPRKT